MGILSAEQASKLNVRPNAKKTVSVPTPAVRLILESVASEFPENQFSYANLAKMTKKLEDTGVKLLEYKHYPTKEQPEGALSYSCSELFSTRRMVAVGVYSHSQLPVALFTFPEPHLENAFSSAVLHRFNLETCVGPDEGFTFGTDDFSQLNAAVKHVFGSRKGDTTGMVEFRYRLKGEGVEIKVKPKGLKGPMSTGPFTIDMEDISKAIVDMSKAYRAKAA